MMKINRFYFGLFLLLAIYFSGCQPFSRVEVQGPSPQEEKTSTIETYIIDDRIQHLEQALLSDDLKPGDRQVTEEFIAAYSHLKKLLMLMYENPNNVLIINRIFQRIVFIEEQYFAEKRIKPGIFPQSLDQYNKKTLALFESFLRKDYDGVIQQCLALEEAFGSQALNPEIGLILALSLAENNRIAEAIIIGEKVIKQLEGLPDLMLLRSKLIEWYMAEGKRNEAMDIYGKLLNDLEAKKALFAESGNQLNKSLLKMPEEKKDQRDSKIQPENILSGIIQEANKLVQQQAFTEAKLLLIKARIKTDNDSEIQIIDQALKNIELTQNRIEQGEEPVNEVSEKESQSQAAALIEEEKYEEAMNIVEKLERQQQIPDAETKRLKDLAVEKIINRDRNRAAQLYLQARNTLDPPKKKALLQSSLDILKNLVEKYPSSYLIKRINDHISIVEKTLNES